jgi:hypothetical protein
VFFETLIRTRSKARQAEAMEMPPKPNDEVLLVPGYSYEQSEQATKEQSSDSFQVSCILKVPPKFVETPQSWIPQKYQMFWLFLPTEFSDKIPHLNGAGLNNGIGLAMKAWRGRVLPKYKIHLPNEYPKYAVGMPAPPVLNHLRLQSKSEFALENVPVRVRPRDPLSNYGHCAHSNEKHDSFAPLPLVLSM